MKCWVSLFRFTRGERPVSPANTPVAKTFDIDTTFGIIVSMANAKKLLKAMQANPQAARKPDSIKMVARAFGLTLRQKGTSQAVVTNTLDKHLTIPMHKPVKPSISGGWWN